MNVAQDIWENYGFLSSPFDTGPLHLRKNSSLPIEQAFIGREKAVETRLFTNNLRSPGGGRLVIEGDVGVGKTSFVNYRRYIWENYSRDKLLTTTDEISICPDWELRHFLLNTLSMLIVRILAIPDGKNMIENSEVLKEIHSFTEVIHNNNTSSLQLQFMGLGGGWSTNEQIHTPDIPDARLLDYFRLMVSEICRYGYAGLLLHYDNLDVLGIRDLTQVRHLFEQIRDTLQTPNVYFVFVGHRGLFTDVIAPLPRVRSIFSGRVVNVPPLTKQQVLDAITTRYKLLAIDKTYVKPVPDQFILYLYDLYEGKFRFIMDAISIIIHELDDNIPATLPQQKAQKILKEIVQEKLAHVLTEKEREILQIAADLDNFNNCQLSKLTGIPTSNVSRFFKKFLELGYIKTTAKQGRQKFYQITSEIRLLQGYEKNVSLRAETQIPHLLSKAQKRQLAIIEYLKKYSKISCGDCQKLLNVSTSTTIRDLNTLVEKKAIIKKGKGRNAVYILGGVF